MTAHNRTGHRGAHVLGSGSSLASLKRATRILRHGVQEWFWTRYHERRHTRLHEVFHSVFVSDSAFLEAVGTLDEFQRWDLSLMLEKRLQCCRETDPPNAVTPMERDRLRRQHALLVARLERGRRLLTERLMRDLHAPG